MLNSEKFIKYLIYGLAFFLPLFFLPVFNSLAGVDNFHKNFLLFATVPWVFVLWLLLKNNGKKFKLEINILDFFILIVFFNILLLAIFICGKNKQMFKKYPQMFLMKSLLVVSFLFLIFINFLPAWWCFSFGLILILIFNFRIFFKNNSYKILILSLFFVSCVFIFFNFYNLNGYSTKERVSQKLQLDIGNTLDIAKKMRGRDLFLGVGLENFKYIFSDLRNAEMNNSPFWHIRFNKTASHILNLFIYLGIFGLLSYLFIFTFWIYAAVKFLRNK